ncbi:MAG: ABC-type transport auxiliary lipoprotein family protein [Sulfuricurvum sp.]
MKTVTAFLVFVIFLTGCSTPTPAIREYTILPIPSQEVPVVSQSTRSLAIAPLRAPVSLSTKQLIYLRDNNETGPYLYARWDDTPSTYLHRSLSLRLEEYPLFTALLPYPSLTRPDWLLEWDLHTFHHRFINQHTSEGYLDLTCRVTDTQTKRVLGTKRFSVHIPASSNDSIGGARALNEAVTEFSVQCLDWFKTLVKEHP